jgi:hypothetical protein
MDNRLIECEEMYIYEQDSDQSIIIEDDTTEEESSGDSSDEAYGFDVDVDDVLDDEEIYLDEEKTDGSYYIGFPCLMRDPHEWIMQTPIRPKTFFKYDIDVVRRYLTEYSVMRMRRPSIHIMMLDISSSGAYNVILKTFWLRIVQRTWKRIYRERINVIKHRCNPHTILGRQVSGTWGKYIRFPTLSGMII